MNIFSRHQCNRILNARTDILNGELRIVVLDNLIKGERFIE